MKWIDANVRSISGEGDMSAFSLLDVTGVLVLEVSTGARLAKAGVRKYDVIFSVNGAKTVDAAALLKQVSMLPAGNSVKLGVSRNQQEMLVEVVR